MAFQIGNVGTNTNASPIRCSMLLEADPSVTGRLLFLNIVRRTVSSQSVRDPFGFLPPGSGNVSAAHHPAHEVLNC